MNYLKPILYAVMFSGFLLLQPFAKADVSYQETTQITGGSMVGMLKLASAFSSQAKQASAPTTTTVMIHQNRMMRANPHTTEIIDLDQRNITFIDHDKRTYSVVTFEQMQQAIANAAAKSKQSSQHPTSGEASQMSFNAHVSRSGATREIDGNRAKEALLTVTMLANASDGSNAKAGMAATSEMWMIDDAPGLAEMRSFNVRMAKEMGIDMDHSPASSLLATQPGAAQALADLKKESAGMSGLPVLQITRVGVSVDGQPLPAPSVAPLPQSKSSGNQSGEVTREIATNTGTETASNQISRLGSFGRAFGGSSMGAFMKHKPAAHNTTQADTSGSENPATAGVLLESQTQLSSFSAAPVDSSNFRLPIGYKQVASPMETPRQK
ncbi:MAG: hypothetical protein H0U76_29120 [Ktedonobacteraceae bacterium]|nr:hypothetical protein [Ktedonobacteraceae bacterium]MBA3916122.1 hypothetical protein [Terriglobales bacterium]